MPTFTALLFTKHKQKSSRVPQIFFYGTPQWHFCSQNINKSRAECHRFFWNGTFDQWQQMTLSDFETMRDRSNSTNDVDWNRIWMNCRAYNVFDQDYRDLSRASGTLPNFGQVDMRQQIVRRITFENGTICIPIENLDHDTSKALVLKAPQSKCAAACPLEENQCFLRLLFYTIRKCEKTIGF